MILGYSNLDSFVYDCFVEKEKSKIKPPFWWLKGKEISVFKVLMSMMRSVTLHLETRLKSS